MGFTMTEVLFAIGILIILFALMFPAMSSLRERSRMLLCVSNMRQLGISLINFTTDHDYYYPPADDSPATAKDTQTWGYWIWPYVGYDQSTFNLSSSKGPLSNDRTFQNNKPIAMENIFQCPTTRRDFQAAIAPSVPTTAHPYKRSYHYSYGMNLRPLQLALVKIAPTHDFSHDDGEFPMNRSMVNSWGATALIVEYDDNSLGPTEFFKDAGLTPHRKGTNILYHDGHVDWKHFESIPGNPKVNPASTNDVFWTGK